MKVDFTAPRTLHVTLCPQLAPRENPDVAESVLQLSHDEGIDVLLGTKVLQIKGFSGERVNLQVHSEDGTLHIGSRLCL